MSKRKDAQKFLKVLVHKLSSDSGCVKKSSTKLYTLTTVHQIMREDKESLNWANECLRTQGLRHLHEVNDIRSNLNYIKSLRTNDIEILRVATLAFLQEKANRITDNLTAVNLPTTTKVVEVVQANDLTLEAFKERFARPRIPVVIKGLSLTKTDDSNSGFSKLWTFDHIIRLAGHCNFSPRFAKNDSPSWARLDTSDKTMTVRNFIGVYMQ